MKRRIQLIALALLIGILPVLLQGTPVKAYHAPDPNLDPNKTYLELRAILKESDLVGHGVPNQAEIGVFKGFSLPIWNAGGNINEELYFSVCVPDRWDGETDIVVHLYTALSAANEKPNAYQLEVSWENAEPDIGAIQITDHDVYLIRDGLSNTQYFLYLDSFILDYDIHPGNIVVHDDELAFRVRRIAAGGSYTELDGEVIIIHAGVLFARGDLTDTSEFITEADMEEIGIQFGIFNEIIAEWQYIFLYLIGLIAIIAFTTWAFWKYNALPFFLAAGASIMWGFAIYDTFLTWLGLTLGLVFGVFGFICIGFGFRCIFWQERHDTKDVVSDD